LNPLLKIENLSVDFILKNRVINAVKNVSFEIREGESFALVGESGAGKSVTALSILRLLPPGRARYTSGRIFFKSTEILGAPDEILLRIRGNRITMIFQEPMSSLNPLHTIEKQIGEVIRIHQKLPENRIKDKVIELLRLVELEEAENRLFSYPHQLSGGQRQRVMIAMAIANNPDLLIADEPTTALDVTVQSAILDLLINLKNKLGMALFLITHDLSIVQRISERVGVMKDGELVEIGEVNDVFSNPSHPYTRYLLNSRLERLKAAETGRGRPLVKTDNLKVHFPIKKGVFRRIVGYVRAVDGVTVEVYEGKTLGVVGESGSGKTTLGLAVLRLIPSEGEVKYRDMSLKDLKREKLRVLRKEIQVIFQDPFGSLNPRFTVEEIVGEGLRVHFRDMDENQRREVIISALEEVGLSADILDRYPHEFSGGQRQRIAIARALVLNPRFIVLDEPTSSLDISVQVQIIELLKKLQKQHNIAYLFISHDLRAIRALSHEIVVMYRGKIVEKGTPEEIFNNPKNDYTKMLIKSAMSLSGFED